MNARRFSWLLILSAVFYMVSSAFWPHFHLKVLTKKKSVYHQESYTHRWKELIDKLNPAKINKPEEDMSPFAEFDPAPPVDPNAGLEIEKPIPVITKYKLMGTVQDRTATFSDENGRIRLIRAKDTVGGCRLITITNRDVHLVHLSTGENFQLKK